MNQLTKIKELIVKKKKTIHTHTSFFGEYYKYSKLELYY